MTARKPRPRSAARAPGGPRVDQRGLVMCPWGCGEVVRRTVNAGGKAVYVDLDDPARIGIIAAYLDAHGVWRSRQLHRGETLGTHETRMLIHRATCWRLARADGRPARPPLRAVPPPRPAPGPIPKAVAAQAREQLAAIRRRRRGGIQ
ncbi:MULTISPECIES: hypothetical protein [Actinomadura]|uniref:Uncharacterized protein n=1 Tax=Actinomadura yumaensis TaxID=111807 RepID=A0ABW2CU53_9ACTN|nr:hypothetical protein [Actinomadura sp. J1-007]MWK39599.1 hypothetical protein [Actinomadura sp. J1-007]